MVNFEYRGGHYGLYLNGYALFNFYAKFGKDKSLLETVNADGKAGYEATIWLFCELSRQGAMYSRFLGDEPCQTLQFQKTILQVQPGELPGIRSAVADAIIEGFTREHPDKELEEDEFLQEFEAQKKTPRRLHSMSRRLLKAWGLASARE